MFWVSPVFQGEAKVSYRALGDPVANLGEEGEGVFFDGVDFLVQVLPGGPAEPVGAAEAVGCDAEVIDEA